MKLELYKVPEFKVKSIRIEKQVLKDAEDLAALCNRKTADFLSVLIEKEVKRMMQELRNAEA